MGKVDFSDPSCMLPMKHVRISYDTSFPPVIRRYGITVLSEAARVSSRLWT